MRSTIRKHSDFIMPENCATAKTPLFIAKARKTIFPNDARYGLITTKKTFRLAVNRNRAKRLLRVWLFENKSLLNPELDYIFIARTPILNTLKPNGVAFMKEALESLDKQND
ncbi:MAG: ribonuclease P protein component [Alphaproteobacteria bacterium]|nr:ribonuclease P protein component [Alphaproteobacteria bacterium]